MTMNMNRVGWCFLLMREGPMFFWVTFYYNNSHIKDFIGDGWKEGRGGEEENGRRSSKNANHVRIIDGDEIEPIPFLHSWNKNLPCKQHKKKRSYCTGILEPGYHWLSTTFALSTLFCLSMKLNLFILVSRILGFSLSTVDCSSFHMVIVSLIAHKDLDLYTY